MFRNFNKLIPEMVKYSELRKLLNKDIYQYMKDGNVEILKLKKKNLNHMKIF